MNYVGVSIIPRSGICSILLFTVFRCRRTVLPSSECLCTTVFECSGYVATTPVEGATDFVFTINKCSNWFGGESHYTIRWSLPVLRFLQYCSPYRLSRVRLVGPGQIQYDSGQLNGI